MNITRHAVSPRASWTLALAVLGCILAAIAFASGGATTNAASCQGADANDQCPGQPGPTINRQELTNRLFAIQVACDGCVLGGNPSPTATTTATVPAGSTGTPGATATPSNTPATTVSPTATPSVPSVTPSPTQPVDTCEQSLVLLVGLDKSASPESVSVYGNGPLDGWYIISSGGEERFDFPEGFVINGLLQVTSGPAAVNDPPTKLRWTTAEVWDDAADDNALLYDCAGTLRSNFDDGF